MRAREYTGYRHVAACETCDLPSRSATASTATTSKLFGADEARPIALGGRVTDPQHFSRWQAKRIHPHDLAWLAG